MKKNSVPPPLERIDLEYDRYRIVAGTRSRDSRAIAYVGTRKVEAVSAESVDAAVGILKEWLDRHVESLRQGRVDGVPSAEEFGEALAVLRAGGSERALALLAMHGKKQDAIATLGKIAQIGETSERSVHAEYSRLAKKMGKLLDFAPQDDAGDRALAPLLVLAIPVAGPVPGSLAFRLRPELVTAMDEKGERT